MPIPIDTKLYEKVKKQADQVYKKHSAYKSGYITKTYVKHGGTYRDDGKEPTLKRWYSENWININPLLGKTGYKTYRPTVRMNEKTPLTVEEIPLKRLKEQYRLKQKIKGYKNLPKF